MNKFIKISTLIAISSLLASCTMDKAGCDPRAMKDAGLLTKMNCDFSGSYDARAQDQQAKLAAEKQNNALLRQALADMEKKNDLVKASVQQRRNDIANITSSTGAYLRQIQKSSAGNQAMEQQIKAAMAQLTKLQNTPVTSGNANAEALKAEIQTLQNSIMSLRKQQENMLQVQ